MSTPVTVSAIETMVTPSGHDIGLEQIGGHAGAVADIVADIVGDRRRVAGIVLGNSGLDLADQVGADVGRLGEDAAAETGEDRDRARRRSESATRRVDDGAVAGSPGTWPPGPIRYQKKPEIASRPRPATSMPVIAPERKARVRPPCRLVRAASAVRTLAFTETFMPTKPVDARQQGADHEADRRRPGRGSRRRVPRRPRRRWRWSCTGGRDRPGRLPGWRWRCPASARCRPGARSTCMLVTMP